MVSLRMDGVVPIGLTDLWRLLWLHLDEDTIRTIHPWILRGRVVGDEGEESYGGLAFPNEHVAEREIRIAGRTLRNTWTYRIIPPARSATTFEAPRDSFPRSTTRTGRRRRGRGS